MDDFVNDFCKIHIDISDGENESTQSEGESNKSEKGENESDQSDQSNQSDEDKNIYVCSSCGRKYENSADYITHIKKGKDRAIDRDILGKKTALIKKLQEKQYYCVICDDKFNSSYELQLHNECIHCDL
jgi:DNA-directed RNA polymerase subunit RPC12/RpoP